MVWTSARAPGLTRMRSASTSSMTLSGNPRSLGREANIRRDAECEPGWLGPTQFAADAGEHGLVERRCAGVRDQSCHMSHAEEDRRGAKRAVLIAGPTASGKSGLALGLAE